MMLPSSDCDKVNALAARIESALEQIDADGVRIAFSRGIAQLGEGEDGSQLMRRADALMYEHKRRFIQR